MHIFFFMYIPNKEIHMEVSGNILERKEEL